MTRVTKAGYRAYINSPQWKAKANAMRFAVGECETCDDPPDAGLEVHHVTYERLGEETPADLLVLCGRCHPRLTGMDDISRQLQEQWALDSRASRQFYVLANNNYPGFWAKVLRTGTLRHLRDGREMRKTGWGGL